MPAQKSISYIGFLFSHLIVNTIKTSWVFTLFFMFLKISVSRNVALILRPKKNDGFGVSLTHRFDCRISDGHRTTLL